MAKPNLSGNTDTCHMYFKIFILALLEWDLIECKWVFMTLKLKKDVD